MEKKLQKSNGASTQPCFVPLVILKSCGHFTAVDYLATHTFMKRLNDLHELVRTADFPEDLPQPGSIDGVKHLSEIYKYHI